MTNSATHVATNIWNAATGVFERVDVEPIAHDTMRDLSNAELSAADLGCEPGTEYRLDLLDAEGDVIESTEVTAI